MDATVIESLEPRSKWLAAIADVLAQAYAVEAELIGACDFPPLSRTRSEIFAADSEFLGCVQSGELVAVVELERLPSTIVIATLAVLPSRFRQGLGRRLVESVIRAAQAPTTAIAVSTGAQNDPAIALYRGVGFRIVGKRASPEGIAIVDLEWRADWSRTQ